MRISAALCFAMLLAARLPLAQPEGLTQAQLNARAKAQNVPEIPFESVPNFLKLPPNLYLGEGIGVATNSKGHIFVYTRSQATRLFEFDQKGNYIRCRRPRQQSDPGLRRRGHAESPDYRDRITVGHL